MRRKSASPVHASAAAIRASAERPRKSSRSSVKSKAASMPRARSAAATISMRPRACPSRSPCAWTLALSERVSGSCSGFVPSRAPIASAVRSSARHAVSDIGSSVSAR